jgi:hypothetical protein
MSDDEGKIVKIKGGKKVSEHIIGQKPQVVKQEENKKEEDKNQIKPDDKVVEKND